MGYQSLNDPYPERLASDLSAEEPGMDMSLQQQFDVVFQAIANIVPRGLLGAARSYKKTSLAARFICDAADVLRIDHCLSTEETNQVMALARQRAHGLLQYSN